jgi:glucose/arabinose dehydrogenase
LKKAILITLAVIIAIVGIGYIFRGEIKQQVFKPNGEFSGEPGIKIAEIQQPDIEIITEDLDIPWEIAFMPSGEMLVTERSGNLLKIGEDRQIIEIEGVEYIGKGGLLGLALHPDFKNNRYLYLYLTSRVNGEITNRVERYSFNLII